MNFIVKHVANIIFISDEDGLVWKAWDDREFTERKLANAMKKIQSGFKSPVVFSRTF